MLEITTILHTCPFFPFIFNQNHTPSPLLSVPNSYTHTEILSNANIIVTPFYNILSFLWTLCVATAWRSVSELFTLIEFYGVVITIVLCIMFLPRHHIIAFVENIVPLVYFVSMSSRSKPFKYSNIKCPTTSLFVPIGPPCNYEFSILPYLSWICIINYLYLYY